VRGRAFDDGLTVLSGHLEGPAKERAVAVDWERVVTLDDDVRCVVPLEIGASRKRG